MKEVYVWLHKDWHRSLTYKQEIMDSDKSVLYYTIKQVSDEAYDILQDENKYKEAKELIDNLI